MRTIETAKITEAIREMCIEANHFLSDDMKDALYMAAEEEKSSLGCQILNQLKENLQIAGEETPGTLLKVRLSERRGHMMYGKKEEL